ncbi:major facilitator superfamily domain-containing protein [Mycena capillaripes]|nr:major facilitator superfamily domain-containing protein [Mycena capillaripes]
MASSQLPRTGATSEQDANSSSVDDADISGPTTFRPEDPATEEEEARLAREALPLWKRPATWLLVLTPLSSIILTSTVGAQVELYTNLACRVRAAPEFQFTSIGSHSVPLNVFPDSPPPSNAIFNDAGSGEAFLAFSPCSSDPDVQAAVTKLTTATTTVTGLLAFVTIGWWGALSDRYGRTRVMGSIASGQLLSPLIILLVAKYVHLLPGGYWFLLVDATITGIVGGTSGEIVAVLAYLSDITTADKRAGVFSFVLGTYLLGIGIGPIWGSFIIRTTHNLLSVFYLAAALRCIHALLIWLVLPESLTTMKMQRASLRHQENSSPSDQPTLWRRVQSLFFFLKPLSILLPEKIVDENSAKFGRRDWNLTFLALAFGAMFLAASSLLNQFLYALLTFDWDAEYLGYCISSIGIARATFLILILPVFIKFVKNRRPSASSSHSSSEHEPLLSDQDSSDQPTPPNTVVFDLRLARFSILVDIAMYTLLPFAPTGILFILFISLGSFGGGLGPALNSVALELYTRKIGKHKTVESGKLFGALSVLQAVCSVIGPSIYGLIYYKTLATHPRTIFFVAAGNSVFAFLLLAFVRVTPDVDDSEEVA